MSKNRFLEKMSLSNTPNNKKPATDKSPKALQTTEKTPLMHVSNTVPPSFVSSVPIGVLNEIPTGVANTVPINSTNTLKSKSPEKNKSMVECSPKNTKNTEVRDFN